MRSENMLIKSQPCPIFKFQYIDSSGRDQGNNVRKKSQSLVLLVNDKERIIEVRQKAAANRAKYDDDRYGGREEDRNGYGYGREREWGYRDDDRSSRVGDHYGRDYEERYGRDGYRDDDYRGRSRSVDYQYESRSRSIETVIVVMTMMANTHLAMLNLKTVLWKQGLSGHFLNKIWVCGNGCGNFSSTCSKRLISSCK